MNEQDINDIVEYYKKHMHLIKPFKATVESFFYTHPELNCEPFPIIHSVKSRIKDPEHLRDKLKRKQSSQRVISTANLFAQITDLVGIRVLHLYQDQFPIIHQAILENINNGEWAFVEPPMAYSWDPETKIMYEELGLKNEIRPTYYTSVHYVIKPNNQNANPICCEIQVRTLFEEIWGEIDHTLNYPHPTESIPCKEQLRVLSKLVSTGTRLADSIFRSHEDYKCRKQKDGNRNT